MNISKKKKVKDIIGVPEVNLAEKKDKKEVKKEEKELEEKAEKTDIQEKKTVPIQENDQIASSLVFQIQVLCCEPIKDPKLFEFILPYINHDQIVNILEERENNNLCGNIVCSNDTTLKSTKYVYSSKLSKYVEYEMEHLFCSVQCMQKYKEAVKVCNSFDFLKFIQGSTFCSLSLLKDYFPQDERISFISDLADKIVKKRKIEKEIISEVRNKMSNFFINMNMYIDFNESTSKQAETCPSISGLFDKQLNIDK